MRNNRMNLPGGPSSHLWYSGHALGPPAGYPERSELQARGWRKPMSSRMSEALYGWRL